MYEILFACVQFLLCFFLTRYSGVSAAPSTYTKHFLGALVSRELTTEQEVLNAVATVPSSPMNLGNMLWEFRLPLGGFGV